MSAVRFSKLKGTSESIAFTFRGSIYQRKISIFVVVVAVVVIQFYGLLSSMLQCTLQANGLGFLGFRRFRLASLASRPYSLSGRHTGRRK